MAHDPETTPFLSSGSSVSPVSFVAEEVLEMKRTVLVCVVVPALVATLSASLGPPVDIETRTKGASRVVVASIVDVHSTFDVSSHGDQLIVSNARLQVEEILKGPFADVLGLTVEGGTVGDLTMRVSDMPAIKAGERAVFFLDPAASGGYRSHGRGLGILKLDPSDRIQGSALTLADVRRMVRTAVTTAGGQR